jgi:hypothetical protein
VRSLIVQVLFGMTTLHRWQAAQKPIDRFGVPARGGYTEGCFDG